MILRLLLFGLLLAPPFCNAAGTNVFRLGLCWDTSPETFVAGYRAYWGPASRQYTNAISVAGRTNCCWIVPDSVQTGTIFFAVTAFTTNGVESAFSEELPVNFNRPGVPSGLRIQSLDIRLVFPP